MPQPTAFEIADLIRRWVEQQFGPDARPGRIVIELHGAPPLTLPVLGTPPADEPTATSPPAREESSVHSAEDFRTVLWHGQVYGFSPAQAKVVAALWAAREAGRPDVPNEALVRAGGTGDDRLEEVFNGSPAWGTLILEGAARGTHRIAPPSPE
ncbi:MAG TPA: hypothetical protein VGF55_29640 [Gemmataceae bacterium]|jgi:hypothetical protein